MALIAVAVDETSVATLLDKSTLGKMMANDDKKTKPDLTPKKEVPPKSKSPSSVDPSTPEGGEKAATPPVAYSRGEGQKPVSKAYTDNWNAIFAKKKTIIRAMEQV